MTTPKAAPKAVPLSDLQQIYKGALQDTLTTIFVTYCQSYYTASQSGQPTQLLTDEFARRWTLLQECDANARTILGI